MSEPIPYRYPWWFPVACCIASFAAGAIAMYEGQKPKPEPPAPAIVQKDHSLILERNPKTPRPTLPEIPKGAKVTRVTTAIIEQKTKPGEPLPPAETIQETTIETKEGSRTIVSSPDGAVIGGSDWTAPMGPPAKVYHWQVQAIRAYSFQGPSWGASIGYTRGPLIGSVTILPGQAGSVQLGLGFRW